MDIRHEFDNFLKVTPRIGRYRLAGKTLRYQVYQLMEASVIVGFAILLSLIWVSDSLWLVIALCIVVTVIALAHHAQIAITKPWLLFAAAIEAVVIWTIYEWGVSRLFALPYFGAFCVFIFVFRFWQRGEAEVNKAAFMVAHEKEDSSYLVEPR